MSRKSYSAQFNKMEKACGAEMNLRNTNRRWSCKRSKSTCENANENANENENAYENTCDPAIKYALQFVARSFGEELI